MSDITDKTQDVNIWNDEYTKKVTVTTDGTKERLDVSCAYPAFPFSEGTPVHEYNYDTDADVGDVQATYTVGTGKILYIFQWGISDNSYGTYQLQIAGTVKDAFINESSSGGMRGLNQVTYAVPLKATAGQVVRIYKLAGLSNKICASIIIGIEVTA